MKLRSSKAHKQNKVNLTAMATNVPNTNDNDDQFLLGYGPRII